MHMEPQDRRRFLTLLAGAAAAVALDVRPLGAGVPAGVGGHPDPRPGIDGSKVLQGEKVPAELTDLYEAVRQIPQIVDGIRCHCGCADLEGFYSLLTCYESSGMALYCDVCQGAGELVVRLHREGRSLDEIRAAIDRRFG